VNCHVGLPQWGRTSRVNVGQHPRQVVNHRTSSQANHIALEHEQGQLELHASLSQATSGAVTGLALCGNRMQLTELVICSKADGANLISHRKSGVNDNSKIPCRVHDPKGWRHHWYFLNVYLL